ncbi:hypothetical protein I4U23_004193 [Adineta vaga]|nr:hypothetical protein I4U23_004193 [Adineta vaga]
MTDLTATVLNNIILWLNRVTPIPILILGTFGNTFNLIIFTRRSLRTNPCSLYFLAGSINNFFLLYIAFLGRYLTVTLNIDPPNTIWCKVRSFITYLSYTLAAWFLVLASIDRYLSSSDDVRFRRWSRLSTARKIIIFTVLFMFLIHLHVIVFFEISISGSTSYCGFFLYPYVIFMNSFYTIVTILSPLIFMFIFGILTIINIRRVRNRIAPQLNGMIVERWRTNDRQLVRMLLFQLLVAIITTIPLTGSFLYNTIMIYGLNVKYSPMEQVIFNFVYSIARLLYFTNPMNNFLVYTLTGPKFRTELKRCIQVAVKFILTRTGLIRYLPARYHGILIENSQIDNINIPLRTNGRNVTHTGQQQTPVMKMSTV